MSQWRYILNIKGWFAESPKDEWCQLLSGQEAALLFIQVSLSKVERVSYSFFA